MPYTLRGFGVCVWCDKDKRDKEKAKKISNAPKYFGKE